MKRMIRSTVGILMTYCTLAISQNYADAGATETFEPAATLDVGNQKCPVSGNPVNGIHSYIHEGKQVNLCSEKCTVPFAIEPEKYVAIAEMEVRSN